MQVSLSVSECTADGAFWSRRGRELTFQPANPHSMLWHMDVILSAMFFNHFTHSIQFSTDAHFGCKLVRLPCRQPRPVPLSALIQPVTFSSFAQTHGS